MNSGIIEKLKGAGAQGIWLCPSKNNLKLYANFSETLKVGVEGTDHKARDGSR
jgi:hypothetical protein